MTDQELNEAVARKLGWTIYLGGCHGPISDGFSESRTDVYDYCHSIQAAWEIVEKIAQDAVRKGGGPLINICHDGVWHCSIGTVIVQADTAPRAICLAFLKLPI